MTEPASVVVQLVGAILLLAGLLLAVVGFLVFGMFWMALGSALLVWGEVAAREKLSKRNRAADN